MTNLLGEAELIGGKSMVSRTVATEAGLRVVLFHFAPGHELAAHRAPVAISIQILAGEGELLRGGEWLPVVSGSLLVLPANEEHGVRATTAMTMLLTMAR